MDVDKTLTQLSKAQETNFTEYRKKGNLIADEVFKILSFKTPFRISRFTIAGSIGKRTSLGPSFGPDFDLVVFVNDKKPPFDQVLTDFENVLIKHYGGNKDFRFEMKTRFSIQFQVKESAGDWISFDLLPAANLLSPEHSDPNQIEQIQTERALMLISQLRDPSGDFRRYSSSLAERNVSFVRQQSVFVHDVIRLAKLWNDKVTWNGSQRISGRSMIIELVAISAANEEERTPEQGTRPSISDAFKSFLKKFINFDRNMNVFFPFQVNQSEQDGESLHPVYEEYQKQINKRPVILDAVNPYNNLAEEFPEIIKSAFDVHATATLNAIENYRYRSYYDRLNIERFFAA